MTSITNNTVKQAHTSIFDTARMLVKKGLTLKEAIEEIETTLHCTLSEYIKSLIKEDLDRR